MMQIIEQTHDERVAMYMKSCTKLQIAEMLTSCNELFDEVKSTNPYNYETSEYLD